jgi:predicted ATPase
MTFEPKKIYRDHVIRAAISIQEERISLHPSTGYDVIVEGKRYPPKEILRISHRIATGNDPGKIYGGKQTNDILISLGFQVESKGSIWKLGCNWGKGAPSFYEFIREQQIVIGTITTQYEINDLVIITEGFAVYAIAKVLTKPQSVTSNERYVDPFDRFQIEYEDNITYATAEWYEIPETEVFTYELQAGIRKVRKRDIIEKTYDIWDNRDRIFESLTLHFKFSDHSPTIDWYYPAIVLTKNNWDDYGHKTTFELEIYKSPSEKTQIGPVKILSSDGPDTILQGAYPFLTDNFCSIGQTVEYYRRLKTELPKQYEQVLRQLNDIAFFEDIRNIFAHVNGYSSSLLRSSEAELLLNSARAIAEGRLLPDQYLFDFSIQIGSALDDHHVRFEFNMQPRLPNRIFGIIGKNGTGKTQFIACLANKLTNEREVGSFDGIRPRFSKVIAASFSYFDNFKLPSEENVSYEFVGVKRKKGLMNETETAHLVWEAFNKIIDNKNKKALWLQSIKDAMETEYLGFDLNELVSIPQKEEFMQRTENIFSSGQKIIFHFLTRFVCFVEDNSLLIFDEPETHLHPNIAGRFIRTISSLLDSFRSFCILSTHSPIVVQEIPSKFIRVFDRHDNTPTIYPPTIEVFGENLSTISNAVFETSEEKQLYKSILEQLSQKYTLLEIDEIFGSELSLNAKLFIQALKESSRNAK